MAFTYGETTNATTVGHGVRREYEVRFGYQLNSQSISDNTSNITLRLEVRSINSTYMTYGFKQTSIIDGQTLSAQTFDMRPANEWKVFGTVTKDVPHNNDGTYSATKSGSFNTTGNIDWTLKSGSASVTFTLPTIARKSSVSATNANIGSTTTISINRASSNFKHTLKYSFGSLSDTIATNVDTSYTWTVPTSFYAQIPDSKTGTCTITCETYNGSQLIGTTSTTFIATASESACKPNVSISAVDTNSTAIALTGSNKRVIKGVSNVQCTYSCSAKNSASITSRNINGTSLSSNSGTYTFNKATTNVFKLTATDSRGYSNNVSTNDLTLVNYIFPTMSLIAYRPQPTTGEIAIEFSGNYFNSSFGSQSNTFEIRWQYKKSSSSQWTTGGTFTQNTHYKISGNTYHSGTGSSTGAISLGSSFEYKSDYDIKIIYKDKLGEYSITKKVTKGVPIVNWNDDTFNVNGKLTVNGTNIDNPFKNILYSNYARGTSVVINGVTITVNDDGSITFYGTNTSSSTGYYRFIDRSISRIKLKNDKTYTFSAELVAGTFNTVARLEQTTDTSNFKQLTENELRTTFKGSYFSDPISVFIRIDPNTIYNFKIKLQLEENDEQTPYVPYAGYIEESGSNDDGSWIKYSDGTMICWGKVTKKVSITSQASVTGWYYDDHYFVTFPVDFINTDYYLEVHPQSATVSSLMVYSTEPYTVSQGYFNLSCNISRTQNNFTFMWKAIGRWK